MLRFHATLHARSGDVTPGVEESLAGRLLPTLHAPAEALAERFAVSFEDALAELRMLPRMFAELDGSFVWVSSNSVTAWQIDGVIYDRGGRVLFVELKGTCPELELDRLLAVFGWPQTPLMFQLSREAVFLDEAAFRCFAGG